MGKIAALVVGGGLGTVARFFLSSYINQKCIATLPLGTIGVNILGCFFIGIFFSLLGNNPNQYLKLLLVIGFLGGFTTFSSFTIETLQLLLEGNTLFALGNIFISVFLGLLAAWAGMVIVHYIF